MGWENIIESPGLYLVPRRRGLVRRAAGAGLHLGRVAGPGQPRRRRHLPRLHHDRGLCQRHHARLHHQPRFRLGPRARQRQMEFAGRCRGAGDALDRQARADRRHGQGRRRARHPGAARQCRSGGRGHARRPHARRRHAGRRRELRAFRHARRHRSACAMRERKSRGREGRRRRGQGAGGRQRSRQQAVHRERG